MPNLYRSAADQQMLARLYQEFLDHWPTANRQLRVATCAGETFIVECGDPRMPPLLLLHGSGSNSVMWVRDVTAWAGRFRVFAVDLIGEPGFSAASRPALASDAHAAWLDDVLQALGLERASFVGASLGAWLALDFATRRPARVDRLVLLGPGGIGRQRRSFLFKMLPLWLLGARGRRKALAVAAGPGPAKPTAGHRRYMEFLELVQQGFRRRMDPLPIFSDASLSGLATPLLAIVGDRDVIFDSAETALRLERLVAGARVIRLPESGHSIFDQGGEILRFLTGIPPIIAPALEVAASP